MEEMIAICDKHNLDMKIEYCHGAWGIEIMGHTTREINAKVITNFHRSMGDAMEEIAILIKGIWW